MADSMEGAAFTVKDWLQRIDAKQDKLDEKIDHVAAAMDRKADARDMRDLGDRVLVLEQTGAQRLELWGRLDKKLEVVSDRSEVLRQEKAERADVAAVWRVLVGALSGSAIAILAWALTLFAR